MSMEMETRDAMRLLSGLEGGTLNATDAYNIAIKRDPAMLYFILRYLREKYPPSNPSSEGVMGRVLELTSTYDDVVKLSKQGEKDILREWFDDSHSMREFFSEPEKLVSLVIEKIEG